MAKALVLSGGGSKGAYQTGVLKHLLGSLKLQYNLICGISVGAINGGFLAMYSHGQEAESIKDLENLWRNLKTSDIYVEWLNWPKPFSYLSYLIGIFKSSLYNSASLIKLINSKFNFDKMKQSGKRLKVGAVSINTGEYRVFDESFEDFATAILASSSFPGAFLPIEIDGQLWTDGGIRNITPLKSAIESDIDSIDVIITSPEHSLSEFPDNPNLLNLAPRVIDIMSEEILLNDIFRVLELNELIKNGVKIPGKKYIDIRVFRPEKSLPGSSLKFEQEYIGSMIDIGYADACRIISV